jgi:Tol biopolymer transport system component
MQQPQTIKGDTQGWPGSSTASSRTADSFPLGAVLPWVLLGLLGMGMFLGLFFYLEQRAAKRIIYLNTDGTLAVVRADGRPATPLILPELEARLPGPVQWAPQGGRFATIIGDRSSAEVLISDGVTETPVRIPLVESVASRLALVTWAPGGNYLAVIDNTFGSPALQLVDVGQSRAVTLSLTLGDLVTATWHPQQSELLLTALNDEGAPALRLVTPDGQVRPFEPEDGQYSRQQGVWSPDGGRVAYIATATLTDTTQTLLVANADATSSGVLVPDGVNFMPVWAPRGDYVFFTQRDSRSGDYALYRVQPDGQGVQPIGRGLPPEFVASDPQSAIAWSPDGTRMLFQSFDPDTSTLSLSVADYDGSNPRVIITDSNSSSFGPMRAIWSPTSRGVLVATWGSEMRLQWLTREEFEIFPEGAFPSWEP